MKTAILVLCLLGYALGYFNEELMHKINKNPSSTWVAGEQSYFKGMNISDIKRLLGTSMRMRGWRKPTGDISLPTNFDSRTHWPQCAGIIGNIRDQKCCGSCWAFGAVESFEDRLCIAKNISLVLSTQNLIACDQNDNGCQGGEPDSAWSYIQSNGLPTEKCQPYTIPAGANPCTDFQPTPQCDGTCSDGSNPTLYFATGTYNPGCSWTGCDPDAMAQDMTQYGSFEVAFTVYEDFLQYKSGVYSHQSGDALGGHAVKLMGFGVENGVKYWLAANSWTNQWGDNGYFKIARGTDECGIEEGASAGHPA